MKKENKENELKNVIQWVIDNRHYQEAMDEINMVTFPFSTKYKNYIQPKKETEDNVVGKKLSKKDRNRMLDDAF